MQLFIQDEDSKKWNHAGKWQFHAKTLNDLLSVIKVMMSRVDDAIGCIVLSEAEEDDLEDLLKPVLGCKGILSDLLCSVLNVTVARYFCLPCREHEHRTEFSFKKLSSEEEYHFPQEELYEKTKEKLSGEKIVAFFDEKIPF